MGLNTAQSCQLGNNSNICARNYFWCYGLSAI